MSYLVEFANRSQLLSVITNLPRELDGNVDLQNEKLSFRKTRGVFPNSKSRWRFDAESGEVETPRIELPNPMSPEQRARLPRALFKGIVPETIEVDVSDDVYGGKANTDWFAQHHLPDLVNAGYGIRKVHLGGVSPVSENGSHYFPGSGWRIQSLDLLVKRDGPFLRSDGVKVEPILRVPSGDTTGWFNDMLQANRKLFYFSEMEDPDD